MSRLRCEGDWPPPGDKLLEQVNIHLWLQDEIIHLLLLYLLQYNTSIVPNLSNDSLLPFDRSKSRHGIC
jgi:hypothetical protein